MHARITMTGAVRAALLIAAVALGFAAPRAANAQQVAVIVNGEPITTYDIEQRIKFTQLVAHKAPSRQEVIEEIINEKLKMQSGARYKIDITEKDVDDSLGDMGKRMRLNAAQLTAQLAQSGIDVKTLRHRIKADLIWQYMVRGKYRASFEVDEKSVVTALLERKKDDKTTYEYSLRPILFVVSRGSAEGTIESRRKEAEALKARFLNCEDGLPVARLLRDVAVRDTIIKSSAELPGPLRDMLDKTEVGRLTNPEQTAQGVEMFAICSRKQTTADMAGKREIQAEKMQEQFRVKSQQYLQELRKSAMIEVK